ncbi:hypothetical protein GUITHDRAFT_103627 [Guillardia theta CCMP2712]|uniref:Uncharacterized protein n=2 Tax=Guillardia theta TaxID=55529 RepID=L1JQ46_GUITC|nr:hypothetical protein GUITHDRAFT_103627 [Guillardia theta CCMP2712]EKX50394.1 hypothetical protein GUITHDRAFT_103627 [Guillardia theta CCMP2712]|mmetsp:Transcript_15376/g.51636  ORF Transcript_15376/g.51636 Transcript_15376/m.51636 type:complete len:283 (+) Transcript_15376:1-849(+)|eukprot:XP_005837374.1 hypothetical protein GUITHDRAFT_103627 [Guillardia theta CCMP2712]
MVGARRVAAVMAAMAAVLLITTMMSSERSTSELDSYQPPSIRWNGWLADSQFPSAAKKAKGAPGVVGGPEDWRANLPYGYHVDEAKVPEDEESRAMQNLLQAAGGGQLLTPKDAWEATERTKQRSKRIIRQRIDSAISNNQFPVASASPCEQDPSGIGCSEYPSGRLTPEYVKAKYGPDMKIPQGAVREVEGDERMMDGSRRSYPESQYDYEWRHLTSGREEEEKSNEGLRARQRMAREEQEEYPSEAPAQHYFKAVYGPVGVEMFNLNRAADTIAWPSKMR